MTHLTVTPRQGGPGFFILDNEGEPIEPMEFYATESDAIRKIYQIEALIDYVTARPEWYPGDFYWRFPEIIADDWNVIFGIANWRIRHGEGGP